MKTDDICVVVSLCGGLAGMPLRILVIKIRIVHHGKNHLSVNDFGICCMDYRWMGYDPLSIEVDKVPDWIEIGTVEIVTETGGIFVVLDQRPNLLRIGLFSLGRKHGQG